MIILCQNVMEVVFHINLNIKNINKKVSEFVRKYVEEHLDKSDPKQEFEVFVVWQCYILGNAIMDILNQIDDVTNSNTTFVLTEKGNTLLDKLKNDKE